MRTNPDRERDIATVARLIDGIEVAMFTTLDRDGCLRSRPMAAQATPFAGELWFFTAAGSAKVDEVQNDQHVNVTFARPENSQYVSVSGRASLIHDQRKAAELWNARYATWFPGGVKDAALALIRVTVDAAEYWDTATGEKAQLAGLRRD